jgi:hypothetical protein
MPSNAHRKAFLPLPLRGLVKLARLREIWSEGPPIDHLVQLVRDTRSDLRLLDQLVETFEKKASSHLKADDDFRNWIKLRTAAANALLAVIGGLVGPKLDSRSVRQLIVRRHVAVTRAYLQEVGAPSELACVGSAACAVHLGGVARSKFKLPESVEFADLLQSRYESIRKRVATQIRKDCDNYVTWSDKLRRVGPAGLLTTLE